MYVSCTVDGPDQMFKTKKYRTRHLASEHGISNSKSVSTQSLGMQVWAVSDTCRQKPTFCQKHYCIYTLPAAEEMLDCRACDEASEVFRARRPRLDPSIRRLTSGLPKACGRRERKFKPAEIARKEKKNIIFCHCLEGSLSAVSMPFKKLADCEQLRNPIISPKICEME